MRVSGIKFCSTLLQGPHLVVNDRLPVVVDAVIPSLVLLGLPRRPDLAPGQAAHDRRVRERLPGNLTVSTEMVQPSTSNIAQGREEDQQAEQGAPRRHLKLHTASQHSLNLVNRNLNYRHLG